MLLSILLAVGLAKLQPAQTHPSVRILLVGLGPYAQRPELGLVSLHGDKDCDAMKQALKTFFKVDDSSFHEVTGSDAKIDKIESEFTDWLIKDAKPTDRMVFFYSGHGTVALGDDNKPCSALIPYDAERDERGAFNPKKLIRRDFFNTQISKLANSGGGSNLTLILDSCDSGLAARGVAITKGVPNPGVALSKGTGAGIDASDLKLGDTVLIGGAQIGTEAYENSEKHQGNLTLAITRALADHAVSDNANNAQSYQDLKDKVMLNMADLPVSEAQVPVFAGNLSRPVFGFGAVKHDSYFLVNHRKGWDKPVILAGGIYGLSAGCTVLIQDPSKDPNAPGIPATVDKDVTPYDAGLILPAGVDPKSIYGRHALVTDWTPDARVSLDVSEIQNHPQRDAILADLKKTKTVTLGAADAAVHLCAPGPTATGASALPHDPDHWYLCTTAGKQLPEGSKPAGTAPNELSGWLDARMRDYGRLNAVKNLKAPDPWAVVTMQIVPVHLNDGQLVDAILPLQTDPNGGIAGRTCEAKSGQAYAIRVMATLAKGKKVQGTGEAALKNAPYIYVLDLLTDGVVKPLWPLDNSSSADRAKLVPDGNWYYLSRNNDFVASTDLSGIAGWTFSDAHGTGAEYLKLIATDESIDITPLLTTAKGATRGVGQLSQMLDAYRNGQLLARGDPITPQPSKLGVDEVTFIITKN